jgi:hypothetical protein
VLDPEIYDKLPEPEDEENDMLDLAFGLEDTYVSDIHRVPGTMLRSQLETRMPSLTNERHRRDDRETTIVSYITLNRMAAYLSQGDQKHVCGR